MKKLFLMLFASFAILFFNSILYSQNSDIPAPTEDYGNQVMKGTIDGNFRYLKTGNVITYHIPLTNINNINVSDYTPDKIPKNLVSNSAWSIVDAAPSVFQALWMANQILPIFLDDFGINYGTLHVAVDLLEEPPSGVSIQETDIINSYVALSKVDGSTFAEYDILSHEICHGYLRNVGLPTINPDQRTLHEGISDIFSVYVEQKLQSLDWLFGDNIPNIDRDLQNPQSTCFLEVQNESSPYTRSGPLVYWFYLLSTGDSSNGIQQMPMKDLVDIVLHAAPLIVNLPQQDYPQLRTATLQIAEQDYGGKCTSLYKSMLAAWDYI